MTQINYFNQYKKDIGGLLDPFQISIDDIERFYRVREWYFTGGQKLFKNAFRQETGVYLKTAPNATTLLPQAIHKNYSDLDKKLRDNSFYRAHAYWFMQEMDIIFKSMPAQKPTDAHLNEYKPVMSFVKHLLLDSEVLFSDFSMYKLAVGNQYGIGKNTRTHSVEIYHGTKQIIYGSGSYGLSFAGSHAYLSISIIRQAVEHRIRNALGVYGKIDVATDEFKPINLSTLLGALRNHQSHVTTDVGIAIIERVNMWSNLYLHSGEKPYSWCAPRVLSALRTFFLAPDGFHNFKAGIQLPRSTFDLIRQEIKTDQEIDHKTGNVAYRLICNPAENCEVVFI